VRWSRRRNPYRIPRDLESIGALFAGLVIAGILALVVLHQVTSGEGRWPTEPRHDLHPRFHRFRLFHAGPRVAGLPLTDDARDDIASQYYPGRPVTFGYGFCSPGDGDEPRCQLPLDVMNYPSCEQNVAKYVGAALIPSRYLHLRGVRVAVFGGARTFDKLLLTTGTTTIIVYAGDLATAIRVVRALRSTDGRVPVRARLPRPLSLGRSRALCQ